LKFLFDATQLLIITCRTSNY